MEKKLESNCDRRLECVSWKARGTALLQSGIFSDCQFSVGEEEVLIKAHRLVLSSASPVFSAMLNGPLAETKFPIRVPDVDPDIFRLMLVCIYTDSVKSVPDDLEDIQYVSEKYMVAGLPRACAEYLLGSLKASNVSFAYEAGTLFGYQPLVDKCLEVFEKQTAEVLSSPTLETAEVNTLIKFFSLPHLTYDSELDLFTFVEQYAKVQGLVDENQVTQSNENKTVIRSLLQKIRFLAVNPKELAAAHKRLRAFLTESEVLALIVNRNCEGAATMPEGFATDKTPRNQLAMPLIMPIPAVEGKVTTIRGYVHKNAYRFNINLQLSGIPPDHTGPYTWIPLHLSVRFPDMQVVRNTYHLPKEEWGHEERGGGMPFTRGEPFELTITCDEESYMISLDAQFFCKYEHRIPPVVTHCSADGDVTIYNVTVN